MSERLLGLSSRIRNEMSDLERLVHRAQDAWHQAQQSGDDLYLDSAALNLHGFYAGLERLFELISGMIDGAVPQGANWHQSLLKQMANEGLQQGVQQGERRVALRLLERRFGKLSRTVRRQIEQLAREQLEALCEALLDFQSKQDLTRWLRQHAPAH